MGNTSKNADRRKRATKASASARKENAAQNSPKKWSRKAPATSVLKINNRLTKKNNRGATVMLRR
ncbi:unnamed protein product [Trifolium pratense]|uniref:Uncharacterized protein n=1 Tax=Trifolium pratense TaxID=57577 RepID=A0ACB0K831_TRIPR|nr:unnamed protein product [Trifolium pratense]